MVKYTEPVDALFARGASRTASHDVVDVTATAPVTTLEETEKELIRRSLERNMGDARQWLPNLISQNEHFIAR